jgi:EAL domain-containing protein (putative c-di-GMP-specific phosphodiesterase class I)
VAQLRRKNLVEVIGAALERSGLRPELLELEVTESLCIESLEAAIEILNAIRALGVRICLDDFGTGYSSLMHLQKLPISTVKIDRQFIRLIENDGDENAMIPAIISLAHKLRLEVVAEGVQTRVQFERLVAYDCDYCQGYLLSRPLPAREVAPLLASVANAGWALDLS